MSTILATARSVMRSNKWEIGGVDQALRATGAHQEAKRLEFGTQRSWDLARQRQLAHSLRQKVGLREDLAYENISSVPMPLDHVRGTRRAGRSGTSGGRRA